MTMVIFQTRMICCIQVGGGADESIVTDGPNGETASLVPADADALAFVRTPAEVCTSASAYGIPTLLRCPPAWANYSFLHCVESCAMWTCPCSTVSFVCVSSAGAGHCHLGHPTSWWFLPIRPYRHNWCCCRTYWLGIADSALTSLSCKSAMTGLFLCMLALPVLGICMHSMSLHL